MQKSLKILLSLAIIVGLGLLLVSNRLESRIESILRNDAVAVLGLGVEVDAVDIHLARGIATISGLKVANPDGFPSDHVFDLSEIHLDISMPSLLPGALGRSPYRIEAVRIEAPEVTVDVDDQGKSNLEQISRTIKKSKQAATADKDGAETGTATSGSSQPRDKPAASKPETDDKTPRFRVDSLAINDLTFNLNQPGKAPENGTLPDIELQDIGGQTGITAAGLGVIISARLVSEILAVVVIRKAGNRLNQRAQDLLNRLFNGSGSPPADSRGQ